MRLVELAYAVRPEDQASFLMDILNSLRRQEVDVPEAYHAIVALNKRRARRAERKATRKAVVSQRRSVSK